MLYKFIAIVNSKNSFNQTSKPKYNHHKLHHDPSCIIKIHINQTLPTQMTKKTSTKTKIVMIVLVFI